MDMSLFFVVAWVLSIAFTGLVAAGVITYMRRTWQLIRADSEGSVQERMLDSLDQIQTQLYSLSEKVARLEGGLGSADDAPGRELPPGGET